jgi:hypothetical protein
MTVTISGSAVVTSSGNSYSSRPNYITVGGYWWLGYDVGSYVMTMQVNPKTPQSYLNDTVNVNGTAGYLIPWPTWYWPYSNGTYGPYTSAPNTTTVTGFITSVSSVSNFGPTNTNYYAMPGTWRASGWCGDGEYIDQEYFYQVFRRVA